MRLVAWNILHGGGPRRMPEITLRLIGLEPDVVILTEFRRHTGGQIAGVLQDHGLVHQLWTDPPHGRNGVFIASRSPLERDHPAPAAAFEHRWLDAYLPEIDLHLSAVHAPDAHRSDPEQIQRQSQFWQHLVALADQRRGGRAIIAGDLNTGRHRLDEAGSTLTGSWFLGRLSTLGYRDAYRLLEPTRRSPTWSSHTGSGFRIDAVWVAARLRNLVHSATHDMSALERSESDHAPVVVDFQGVLGSFEGKKSEKPEKTRVPGLAAPKEVR